MCRGEGQLLEAGWPLTWYRCRQCGCDFMSEDLRPDEGYDDGLRLDEMQCVDDYNRFEENCLAGEFEYE